MFMMGKIRMLAVTFQEPQNQVPVFFPGQVVSGVVTVDLAEPMQMQCIHVNCKGKASVEWEANAGGTAQHPHHNHLHNHEVYIDLSTAVIQNPNVQGSTTDLVLPQGFHQYPFSFALPPGLPPSFQGLYGNVRYWITATIQTGLWRCDQKTIRPFIVISPVDLNSRPDLQIGLSNSSEKTVCCLCCASGPITAEFQIPRSGFVPGEKIFMNAVVKNKSSRSIQSVEFQLRQKVDFHGPGLAVLPTTRTLLEVYKEGVQPYGTRQYSDVKLEVPPLPPSGLPGCKIIEVFYVLTMVVKPSGAATNLTVPFIITIGSIPFRDSYQFFMQRMAVTNPSTPALGASASPPPAPVLPPAAYAELFEKWTVMPRTRGIQEEGTHGIADWTPLYMYYNFQVPVATPMGESIARN